MFESMLSQVYNCRYDDGIAARKEKQMLRLRDIFLSNIFAGAISFVFVVVFLIGMFTFTVIVEFRREFIGCFSNIYSNGTFISIRIGDRYVEVGGERIPAEMYRDKVGFSLSPKQRIFLDSHGNFVISKGYTSLIRLNHDSVTLSTTTGGEFYLNRVPCELR